MFPRYPESLEAHMKDLRRDFTYALASTKEIRPKGPLPDHILNESIRNGVKKGIKAGLSRGKLPQFESEGARTDVENMISSQISNELLKQMQKSGPIEPAPRDLLKSLNNSFQEFSYKYNHPRVNLATNAHPANPKGITTSVSPAEIPLKMEHETGSPPDFWQQEQSERVTNQDTRDATDFKIVVSLTNTMANRHLNDGELAHLVNQSIGSDPEIPDHLRDSKWITGANLLDNGDIEVHVETEDDRDFLSLNTHWRPKLDEVLAARDRMYTFSLNAERLGKLHSMLCAPGDTPLPGLFMEGRHQVLTKPPYPDQQNGCSTAGRKHSHLPITATSDSYVSGHTHNSDTIHSNPGLDPAHSVTHPEFAAPTFARQPARTEPHTGHNKREAPTSDGLFCSNDISKRARLEINDQ